MRSGSAVAGAVVVVVADGIRNRTELDSSCSDLELEEEELRSLEGEEDDHEDAGMNRCMGSGTDV